MKPFVIYRGTERIQGTAEEISTILGMRLYVFNRFLKTGKAYNNPRLKGVRVTDEKPVKTGMAAFVQAVSGGALYRKSTFLLDSLGTQVFPSHIQVLEDPHIVGAVGSA